MSKISHNGRCNVRWILTLWSIVLCHWFLCQPYTHAATVKVSNSLAVPDTNPDANGLSSVSYFGLSADGTKVVFGSSATNVGENDTNPGNDVFVHNITTGATTLVSVNSSGVQANSSCGGAVISADGTKVAFSSGATNLVPGDTNQRNDVFVRDLTTGITNRVSVDSSGKESNGYSDQPSLSADGTKVAFASDARNLGATGGDGTANIFVHDLFNRVTTLVTVGSSGNPSNDTSSNPALSADGKRVAFDSFASNLVSNDTNGDGDVFVHDLATGTIIRASVSSTGVQGNSISYYGSLNGDGTKVIFQSAATNLASDSVPNNVDVFVRDLTKGVTSLVSVSNSGIQGNSYSVRPSISADGRKVAFESLSNNLVSGDANSLPDIFVRDIRTGVTTLVNVSNSGTQANQNSFVPSLNSDGTKVAYQSFANNLVRGDTNNFGDVFVSDVPTLSISDATVTEGDSGTRNAVFTVTLSQVSNQTVAVSYRTLDSTATARQEYVATNGTLTFNAGQTTKTFIVPIVGDTLAQDTEYFFVNLSNHKGAPIGDGQGRGFILDNDRKPSVNINDVTVAEGNSGTANATFTVQLSTASGQTISVYAVPYNGSARASLDYIGGSVRLIFAPGETTKTFSVAVHGDTLDETNETFYVVLSAPVNVGIGRGRGLGLITDDDRAPALAVNDASISEGNSGTKLVTFTVTLSKASGQNVTVNYATADGIARSTSDYIANRGTLTFTPGSALTRAISITINGDGIVEGDETLYLLLSSPVNASTGRARGVGTVLNDDSSGGEPVVPGITPFVGSYTGTYTGSAEGSSFTAQIKADGTAVFTSNNPTGIGHDKFTLTGTFIPITTNPHTGQITSGQITVSGNFAFGGDAIGNVTFTGTLTSQNGAVAGSGTWGPNFSTGGQWMVQKM